MYMPFSGTIVEINESLNDDPTVVNDDPYGKGWMAKVKPSSPKEVDALMRSEAYAAYTEASGDSAASMVHFNDHRPGIDREVRVK